MVMGVNSGNPTAARRSWPREGGVWLLLDYLVRSQQQCLWDREAEGLRGLEIDDQLELRGLLDRKIARLCTIENLVYGIRGAAVIRQSIRAVGEQSSCLSPPQPRNHRPTPRQCEFHDAPSLVP